MRLGLEAIEVMALLGTAVRLAPREAGRGEEASKQKLRPGQKRPLERASSMEGGLAGRRKGGGGEERWVPYGKLLLRRILHKLFLWRWD